MKWYNDRDPPIGSSASDGDGLGWCMGHVMGDGCEGAQTDVNTVDRVRKYVLIARRIVMEALRLAKFPSGQLYITLFPRTRW